MSQSLAAIIFLFRMMQTGYVENSLDENLRIFIMNRSVPRDAHIGFIGIVPLFKHHEAIAVIEKQCRIIRDIR